MSPENKQIKKTPWYFLTLIFFFVTPILILLKKIKSLNVFAFSWSLIIIVILGYIWTMTVSANQWWSFNPTTMLGIEILPNLPLEEAMFYPLGGALSLLLYTLYIEKTGFTQSNNVIILTYILMLTSIFVTAIFISKYIYHQNPAYLISQVILFNLLSLIMWYPTKNKIAVIPALLTTVTMSVIGFFWDWLAFTHGWWVYQAVLGWYWPTQVPIDDWNFFMFAPLAAISLYELIKQRSK